MNTWLPTGKLSNGTFLFGPLRERPQNWIGPLIERQVDGRVWYVGHSGKEISSQIETELLRWIRTRAALIMKIKLPGHVMVEVNGVHRTVGLAVVDGESAVWAMHSSNTTRASGIQLSEYFPSPEDGRRIIATVGFEVFQPDHPQIIEIVSALRSVPGVEIS